LLSLSESVALGVLNASFSSIQGVSDRVFPARTAALIAVSVEAARSAVAVR
jgi:hypothetical protein